MYVQSNNDNYNVSMYGLKNGWNKFSKRIGSLVNDALPVSTFKNTGKTIERMKKIEDWASRPHNNRLIMGVMAIIIQPLIDYYNHRVDEETRVVSRNRTIAKIIAGTSVGMVVRGLSYGLVKQMTNPEGKDSFSKGLLPKKFINELQTVTKYLYNYRNALSMFTAIFAMLFTNFLADAPLTIYFANRFNAKSKKLKEVSNG
ncbi:MAG: hypothetical protein MJ237_04100 [bacterium]|nr:hypothetical protein [bacterium]